MIEKGGKKPGELDSRRENLSQKNPWHVVVQRRSFAAALWRSSRWLTFCLEDCLGLETGAVFEDELASAAISRLSLF